MSTTIVVEDLEETGPYLRAGWRVTGASSFTTKDGVRHSAIVLTHDEDGTQPPVVPSVS